MAGAYLAVGDSGWRIMITGNFDSGALPSGYIDKLQRFEGAIKVLAGDPGKSERHNEREVCLEIPEGGDREATVTEDTVVKNPLIPTGWPESGTVTLREITTAWKIGASTFRNKVSMGIYPEPVDAGTLANQWSAAEVMGAILSERSTRKHKKYESKLREG